MALDGCGAFCKCILIFFNVIFALVGFACLGLGLWLRFSDNTRVIFTIHDFDSSTFVVGVTLLIVLGCVMLFVVMVGGYVACSEERCALIVVRLFLLCLEVGFHLSISCCVLCVEQPSNPSVNKAEEPIKETDDDQFCSSR
uniref:CD81 antigen-like n=1 Tax=Monopterus albus TaxID=43700 RepID=UPI0009B45770|nr:CD81 antigen-like [Monopterus albus]XP_020480573.1 CD81 antigen-like [Monopterus albus]